MRDEETPAAPCRGGLRTAIAGLSARVGSSGQASTFIGGAFFTFPAEMHEVHTRTRLRVPTSSTIFTVWRFGNQRRRVLLWAWLTLFPVAGPLPHT
jgi:hypothetical protein